MVKPISVEIREAIVNSYNEGLGTINEIAKIFSITPRSVLRYLKLNRDKGDLSAKKIPGRPPILTDKNLAIIKNIILSKNDETLEQYREKFYKETGIKVTIVTIHNACTILDLRRKKKSFYAAEQEREDVKIKREDVKIKREDFLDSMEYIDPRKIVVIDESGADLRACA